MSGEEDEGAEQGQDEGDEGGGNEQHGRGDMLGFLRRRRSRA
jgi:hypothetical protein